MMAARALVIGLVVAAVAASGCKDPGDVEVKDLTFTGVHAFPVSELKAVLATRQSGWLPWSAKHYFDRTEFERDLDRIHAFYADRGYPNQRVTNVAADLGADRKSVRVRIEIDEGEPIIVQDVRFEGFGAIGEADRKPLDAAPLKANGPRDRNLVRASRDLAAGLLRDHGYPFGYVDAGERPGDGPNRVVVTFRADPGDLMQFGQTSVDGLERVRESVVRRQISFQPGQVYRESAIMRTQRRLSNQEVFELVAVTPRLEEAHDSQVPVRVTLAEGKPRQLKFGFGYGTEERARGSFSWQHLNLFGTAQRLEAAASASFLDQNVNVSYVNPYLGRPRLSLSVTGVAERTQQLTYDSESYGARFTVRYRNERTRGGPAFEPVRYDVRFGYRNEYLRYGIRPEALGDLSQRDERIALGLDPETGRGKGTLAALTLDLERGAVDDAVQPRKGTIASLHLEHAATWLGGTYKFSEVLVDGRGYLPLGSMVLANHVEFGSVIATDPSTVPFSKRYFLGGATSLRGWGRYQVAPLDDQGLPIGGRTLVAGSSELRFPLSGKLSGVAFIDAGNVGASDLSVEQRRLRVDVGPGLRYQTPIGALRADLGYQLTPIEGLQINGAPEQRHWRVHVSLGQAF